MHLGVESQPLALTARRLYSIEAGQEHTIEDFRFEYLKAAMIEDGLSPESGRQLITYPIGD